MPRRRLLAVAVAGVLALPALAACRDMPSVAAYVGGAQLTNAQVDKMVAEFPEDRRQTDIGDLRRGIVSLFVTKELSHRLADQNGITVPPLEAGQVEAIADDLKVKPDSEVARLDAEATTARRAIARIGGQQAPTEADKREVFEYLVRSHQVGPNQYEQVKNEIDSPDMQQALGLRKTLRDALHTYQVTVNPRYEPLGVPVPFTLAAGNVSTFVLLSLESTAPPAVVDRS
jgi:hypothetical protein